MTAPQRSYDRKASAMDTGTELIAAKDTTTTVGLHAFPNMRPFRPAPLSRGQTPASYGRRPCPGRLHGCDRVQRPAAVQQRAPVDLAHGRVGTWRRLSRTPRPPPVPPLPPRRLPSRLERGKRGGRRRRRREGKGRREALASSSTRGKEK